MVNSDSNPPNGTKWFCVLDTNMRTIYLGRDEAKALQLWDIGCAIGSAKRMGDAIRNAAMAAGSACRPRN